MLLWLPECLSDCLNNLEQGTFLTQSYKMRFFSWLPSTHICVHCQCQMIKSKLINYDFYNIYSTNVAQEGLANPVSTPPNVAQEGLANPVSTPPNVAQEGLANPVSTPPNVAQEGLANPVSTPPMCCSGGIGKSRQHPSQCCSGGIGKSLRAYGRFDSPCYKHGGPTGL